MLEDGGARVAWVRSLRDVCELLLVAEQDDAIRGLGDGDRIGEGHLPGLVDEQDVDGAGLVLVRPIEQVLGELGQ